MLIDWFTVIAQVINFLILAWLLKRFLYRPILNAIDAREQRIAAKLADADAKKAAAQQEHDEFLHKNEEFDKQSSARLNQALDEAKAERQRLLNAARLESDDLRAKLQEALKNEQRNLSETLTRRAREEVFAIARKALADLAGTTLEARMTEIFLRRLRELNDTEMAVLQSAFKATTSPLLVRTAFILSPEQCAAIETAIKQTLGKEKQVQFETVPDLVSGIEISANGQKVAWSIAEYLTSLGKSVDDLLKAPTIIQAKPEDSIKSSYGQSTDKHGT